MTLCFPSPSMPPPRDGRPALQTHQAGFRPVRFKIFVNDEERMTEAYKRYLVNTLRSTFGLEGAPIVLILESRRREDTPVRVTPSRIAAKKLRRRPGAPPPPRKGRR